MRIMKVMRKKRRKQTKDNSLFKCLGNLDLPTAIIDGSFSKKAGPKNPVGPISIVLSLWHSTHDVGLKTLVLDSPFV